MERVLRGTSDANISFAKLCRMLRRLDFDERVRSGHHVFTKEGVEEVLNFQSKGAKAKPYQVKQVRRCMADGASYQEVIANVEMIIQERIEIAGELGWLIPELKGRLIYT